MLRRIVEGQISAEEAVRAYHGVLQGLNIKPYRSMDDDMKLLTPVMSYAATTAVTVPASKPTAPAPKPPVPAAAKPASNGHNLPNLAKMTAEERLAYPAADRRGLCRGQFCDGASALAQRSYVFQRRSPNFHYDNHCSPSTASKA